MLAIFPIESINPRRTTYTWIFITGTLLQISIMLYYNLSFFGKSFERISTDARIYYAVVIDKFLLRYFCLLLSLLFVKWNHTQNDHFLSFNYGSRDSAAFFNPKNSYSSSFRRIGFYMSHQSVTVMWTVYKWMVYDLKFLLNRVINQIIY